MYDFLVFRLYGAMASWGRIAVGESRHSDAHPSKSAIMGMIAAALGIRRSEEEKHRELFSSYGFGVKVISMGTLMQDYHTVQVPPEQRKTKYCTRYEELNAHKLGTAISLREYRCDALYNIAVWPLVDMPPYSPSQLAMALNFPRFALYLGRKSCPPGIPLQATTVHMKNLKEALDTIEPMEHQDRFRHHSPHYYWDDIDEAGDILKQQTIQIQRYDVCTSRKRWQFEARIENAFIAQEK